MSRVLFFPSSSSRASFSIARARLFALAIFFHPLFLFSLRFKVVIFSRPPFFQPVLRFVSLLIFFFGCSCAFIFEVQGLPLLLKYFLSISSSWTRISSSTLFLLLIFYLFVLSKLFPPNPLVALLFSFISVFIVFHFQLLAAPETSYPSFFISSFFFVFSFLFFLSSYKLYIQLFLSILIWSPFRTSLSAVLFTENFVSLLPSCCLTFTSFFSAFPLWSVVPSRLCNHI